MRVLVLAAAAVLLLAAPAQAARLRPVGALKAAASGAGVKVTWKDRASGETRYEVRRAGLSVRVARNRTRYTDRKAKAGKAYRYSVRACRAKRCAKARTVRIALPAAKQQPPAPPAPAPVAPGDPFAGSPTIGGCPVFPKDSPWNTDVSRFPVDTSHDYI